ncbi:carboxyl transferase domain-containing protein [Corynebacterium glutamicum]|uniref:carboxyl transferase domain-containing protein n=1 Tax=Corynebacterium glutamicum TaxID=1718 RepID=UPI00117E3B47|nr:carboxyl transferase domain-containing protein [Corynebacterium glutamicum]QDQ21961.1 acetyl-CoA carboxylase carboxyl transferase subunit alpha/beta [Corynebacterium glutamicum]QDQ24788.1 acetyl-CoA carboxylase carboxyl transferase subunit alpha/beta [Corynebacterium glutamicum]
MVWGMEHTSALTLIDSVLDPDSFISWDETPQYDNLNQGYAETLERARSKAKCDESVITGEGTVEGIPVAVILSDFSFLGGSLGTVASVRIMKAIHRATELKLPLLVSPASGGARMQEDNRAFVMMVSITAAVQRHREAHLPFLVYLRNPTMGGAMASWGSSGHLTFAEPGAQIGFLGPRVVELTTGHALPDGVQQAENLVKTGVIDGIVSPLQLRAAVAKTLKIIQPAEATDRFSPTTPGTALPVMEAIARSRDPHRPGIGEIMETLGADVVKLSGARAGALSPAVRVALARIGGRPVVLIGQDRRFTLGPQELRFARRGISLARELNLPIVSIIDTSGAELSQAAEELGIASSIARTLSKLIDAPLPTVSVIIGQGVGGGALAMLPADLAYAAENAWLSALPPEGASAILFRDTNHAAEIIERQGVQAHALLSQGLIDGIVAETEHFVEEILGTISNALSELDNNPERAGRDSRFTRFERLAQ